MNPFLFWTLNYLAIGVLAYIGTGVWYVFRLRHRNAKAMLDYRQNGGTAPPKKIDLANELNDEDLGMVAFFCAIWPLTLIGTIVVGMFLGASKLGNWIANGPIEES